MSIIEHMIRIGIRELRQHASTYIAEVKRGRTVEVTERGQLVALLVPPSPAATVRERLIGEGRLIPASSPFSLPTPVRADRSIAEVLEEMGEERHS